MKNTSENEEKCNLLIIDDEDSCLTALEVVLFSTKYKLVKASNGQEGINYIVNNPGGVDIILLDLMMPGINGIEVIRSLKEMGCKIPVILQTASCSYADITKALKLGAKGFLSKPFDKNILMSVLNKALTADKEELADC